MAADAFSRFADSLPASTPDELRGAFRSLGAQGGSPEEVVGRLRLASDLASPPSAAREVELVDRWLAAPPTHARYCFLAEA